MITEIHTVQAGQTRLDFAPPHGAKRMRLFNEQGFLMFDGPVFEEMERAFLWEIGPPETIQLRIEWEL